MGGAFRMETRSPPLPFVFAIDLLQNLMDIATHWDHLHPVGERAAFIHTSLYEDDMVVLWH